MKKWTLFLSAYFCLCLLASCAAAPAAPGGAPAGEAPPAAGPISEPAAEPAATVVCRVVSGAEEGTLLLAGQGDGAADVYRLSLGDLPVAWEDPAAAEGGLRDGALVEVGYNGNVEETFPARLSDVTAVKVLSAGFDDRCALYRTVLNDLWEVDPGLNGDITELGVDLSATGLSPAEQAALSWAFGEDRGIAPVQGTYAELVEQGYIDGENLLWEKGCLFSITEQETGDTDLTFNAEKWRSGLGAYFFVDCTASRSADGTWGGYTVGAEAIS